ncbi:MAG: hypothetical protein JWM31_365 [Solirubrobacterales bacterium]|nr:hypothetical protein [Solirubrobacterales bacterium]
MPSEERPTASLLDRTQAAFSDLPERYLGGPAGFDATYHVRIGDIGRTFEVRCTRHGARVRTGITRREPDVVIGTDAATWLRLREGELSGIDAFGEGRLYAHGDVDRALAFEGLFRLPNGRPPLLRVHDVRVPAATISTLTTGQGPDVVLIHGLGAAKTSFFPTVAALSRQGYRVHAIDLPGFGSSSKPLTGAYDAGWFAEAVVDFLDASGIQRAHLIGNSMGGRVALEVALRAPQRVNALGLLSPAVAFVRRDLLPLVRVLRPELGLLPHRFTRAMVAGQIGAMLADPDAMDPAEADVAVDEFQRVYSSAAARLAFLRSARNIYLDRPFGPSGFYTRLGSLRPPALFVWGSHDALVPAAFRHHVERALPSAEHVLLQECGHIPQIERPEETHALLVDFLARAEEREDATNGVARLPGRDARRSRRAA